MSGMMIARTPEVIATEINVIKGQARDVYVRSAIEIGKRLYEAKAMVPYGKWGEWLKNNVDYSERTAQNLIAVYDEYGRNGDSQAIAGLNFTQAVLLLRLDGETRAELLEEKDVPGMSVRELEEEIRKANAEIERRQVTFEQLMEGEKKTADALRAELKAAKAEESASRQRMGDAVKRAEDVSKENLRLKQELEAEKTRMTPQPVIEQVEVVPEDVERELEFLREQAKNTPDKAEILLRDAYGRMVKQFEEVAAMIGDMEEDRPEAAAKFRKAVATAAVRMAEKLGGA